MKKTKKSILALFIAAFFMAMSVAPAVAAEIPKKIDYVAFGDSVAAGVRGGILPPSDPNYDKESEFGYTDNIANKLEEAGVLGNFNEDFAISGMTAERLAKESAVLNYPGIPQYLVQNAEIITLDIGANDLLGPLYTYVATLSDINDADPLIVKGILEKMVYDLYYGSTASDVQHNIEMILQNILNTNPNVKIYVMGYYNALPAMSAYGVDLYEHMVYFNSFINNAIKAAINNNNRASITYIDTMAAMAKNSDKNLVPTDIHPTEAGYRVIAKEFWNQIKLNLRGVK